MKKISFLFVALLLLTGCSSAPTFDTSLLIGKWFASETDYEDGIATTTIMGLVFENNHQVTLGAKFNIDGDYYGEITGHGEYEVSGDKIKLNIPESNIDFKLNRKFFDSYDEYDAALKETREEMLKEIEQYIDWKVISISADQLVVDEDDEIIEFNKFE